ncbi:hypothetical protein U0355_09695 [Salimicrobium sp. PL1-032A]|uniref:hypothetical protein n=1 Tax=Salimicrobium sp. PL1-032A TaxID=3095364 RepID=UPI0032615A1A
MFKDERVNIIYRVVGWAIILGIFTYLVHPVLEGFIPWMIHVLILVGYVFFLIREFRLFKDIQKQQENQRAVD